MAQWRWSSPAGTADSGYRQSPVCIGRQADRVLCLDDLRDDRGELELVDENTGEVIDVVPGKRGSPQIFSPTESSDSSSRDCSPVRTREPASGRPTA